MLILTLAGPVLVAGLVTGVAISILQAVTQVQEMTLAFIPKLIVTAVVFTTMGGWMLGQLVGFTTTLLMNLDQYAR
jgi:flagellar biosynthetic protein FliQ